MWLVYEGYLGSVGWGWACVRVLCGRVGREFGMDLGNGVFGSVGLCDGLVTRPSL